MTRLLVVDPLNLVLKGQSGQVLWSSRDPFLRVLSRFEGLELELADGDDPDLCQKAAKSDGVVLGGSEQSAWSDSPFNDNLLDLIAICRNGGVPFLGICYGCQLLGRALGATVGPHPDGLELGAPPIRLTAKGRERFLFRGVEQGCIWAVETHSDAVLTMPPDCELLASTAHTPVQAFSYRGLLTGVQFHPEMGAQDLRFLWRAFQQRGIVSAISAETRQILNACDCAPAAFVLRNFVERARTPALVW